MPQILEQISMLAGVLIVACVLLYMFRIRKRRPSGDLPRYAFCARVHSVFLVLSAICVLVPLIREQVGNESDALAYVASHLYYLNLAAVSSAGMFGFYLLSASRFSFSKRRTIATCLSILIILNQAGVCVLRNAGAEVGDPEFLIVIQAIFLFSFLRARDGSSEIAACDICPTTATNGPAAGGSI